MKRKLLVAVPLLCLVALLPWFFRPKHESLSDAYINERSVTLWSSIAQVREQLGVLLYGDHVDVLARHNENVKVRTAAGLVGWVDGRYLMEPELWQRSAKLLQQASAIPIQARGRNKVPTNLRCQPGTKGPPPLPLPPPGPRGNRGPPHRRLGAGRRRKKTRQRARRNQEGR